MEISKFIELFRTASQDIEYPGDGDDSDSLFKNSEIIEYIDFAQKEFARRTEVLKDSRTKEITQLKVKANDPWVEVSNLVIFIKKAALLNHNTRLKLINERKLSEGFIVDDYGCDWEGDWETKTGTPQLLVTDMDTSAVRLFPIPVEDDTLTLQVTRYPLDPIESVSSEFEIPEQYQRKLLHHVLYTAYSKQDADSFDPQKAESEFAQFELAIEAARRETSKRYQKTGTVKYGGL